MRNEHHVESIKCSDGRFDHFLVTVKIIHIEHECLYALCPPHLQVVANILKFFGGASDQEKLHAILSEPFGRFLGNRRGRPYNQYSHRIKPFTPLLIFQKNLHAARNWRRSVDQRSGQTPSI